MTPDMKRLCEAVADVGVAVEIDHRSMTGWSSKDPVEWEAVVRAILAELREPSDAMEDAGGSEEVSTAVGDDDYNVEIGSYVARVAFTAMIDHILTTADQ